MFKVLFVCVHNSARSQMAEAFLNRLGKDLFIAESAGIEAGKLNPYVVRAMMEMGYDISGNSTNSVFDYFKQGRTYNAVIKVCDQANGQRCPIFPRTLYELNWSLTDPSTFTGTDEDIMSQVRIVRDEVQHKVEGFMEAFKDIALKKQFQ
jgi:arsenate reductase (thioredoxin)